MDSISQPSNESVRRTVGLIAAMCVAQVIGMVGSFAFPALLPHFLELWQLSNSQAGWINGIYFAGYAVSVPVLTALTDRVDARNIYLWACFIALASNLGFALFSTGFYPAMIFRSLCGLGLAGTFIPGLKALIDRIDNQYLPRAVSFYTACFGLGMSFSFYAAGTLFAHFGWKPVFYVAAGCSAAVLAACGILLKPKPVLAQSQNSNSLKDIFDFSKVWRNKKARTYILAYTCHMWEMFAARSWMVAFLTFSLTLGAKNDSLMAPTTVMAVAGIFGMVASIGFGELAARFSRRKTVTFVMSVSALLGLGIGFFVRIPYPVLVCLCIGYTFFFQGDSAAIHAGVITAAQKSRQGATMALQSLAGFAAASLSPVVVGLILDLTGGGSNAFSWGMTFASMGIAAVIGIFLFFVGQKDSGS